MANFINISRHITLYMLDYRTEHNTQQQSVCECHKQAHSGLSRQVFLQFVQGDPKFRFHFTVLFETFQFFLHLFVDASD